MSALFRTKKMITIKPRAEKLSEVETIVCPKCSREISKAEAEKNKYVCYECGNYFRVRTKNRINMVADRKSFEAWFDFLEFENSF